MEKGIVLLDMPKGCLQCEYRDTYFYCYFTNESIFDFCSKDNIKPESCPVREVPEKKDVTTAVTMTDFGFINGWNAILESLGE